MSTAINLVLLLAVLFVAWCWLVERNRRQRDAEDHEARLAAAFSSLRHYQMANDTLAAEVRKREVAIARHLARENAAAVAKAAASQQRIVTKFAMGLPVHHVDPSQFSRN